MITYSSSLAAPKLLILGGPASGKTTYRTQLYFRVENNQGQLRLAKSINDTVALEADVDRLASGLQPNHTHLEVYHSTSFLLEDSNNRSITLDFADYGGEQVEQIESSNVVPDSWSELAKNSSCWLFFLRIDSLRSPKSFMTDPVEASVAKEKASAPDTEECSRESKAIEGLQRLLFVRGVSLRNQISSPRLGLMLSCWDELSEEEQKMPPRALLDQRAPLLGQFIRSNWTPKEHMIWGLSSTGKRLPLDQPDVEFAQKGPNKFGYLIEENGKRNADLTIPINWLIQAE